MSSIELWCNAAGTVTARWNKEPPHYTVHANEKSWSYCDAQAAIRAAKRRAGPFHKETEIMIFAHGKWEFAHREANEVTGKAQWIRRDFSWICYVGEEVATMAVPPRPPKKEELSK